MKTFVDAVVVGGGVSGLIAARELASAGLSVELIEASDKCGGSIQGHTLGGIRIDIGAEAYSILRPEVTQLVTELGLSDYVVTPFTQGAHLILGEHGEQTLPIPKNSLLGIPSDLMAPDVLRIIGLEVAMQAQARDALPVVDLPATLGELVEQRMGTDLLERLVDPIVAGVHAISAIRVEVDAVAPRLRELTAKLGSLSAAVGTISGNRGPSGNAIQGLRGGMGMLIEALVSDLRTKGVSITLSTIVDRVLATPSGWTVSTKEFELPTRNVVLAIPTLHSARALNGDLAISNALSMLQSSAVRVTALMVDDERFNSAPLGSGALVGSHVSGIKAKALTHANAKWEWLSQLLPPNRHIFRLSYGRNGLLTRDQDEQTIIDDALHDLAAIYHLPVANIKLVDSATCYWENSMTQALVGSRDLLDQLGKLLQTRRGLGLLGPGISGNGLAGVIFNAKVCAKSLVESGNA